MMKVRITKCENEVVWYKDKIGQVFEVEQDKVDKGCYLVVDKERLGGGSCDYVLDKADCEVVSDEWWGGLTDGKICELKHNRLALTHLDKRAPWAAKAFREMPAEDRVFLDSDGVWFRDTGDVIHDGWTYRLREDWERPDDKSELFEKLEKWEAFLKRNTSPLDLIDAPRSRTFPICNSPLGGLMKQALEAGLCEKYWGNKWKKIFSASKSDFAIRLAPDWRERLAEKGGAGCSKRK